MAPREPRNDDSSPLGTAAVSAMTGGNPVAAGFWTWLTGSNFLGFLMGTGSSSKATSSDGGWANASGIVNAEDAGSPSGVSADGGSGSAIAGPTIDVGGGTTE